ncbi:MAG: type I DNA topoisomerase [Kiritimatiellae bacterium]|nr:type I DNA topoisomerase [Kiritimatiellia bacterium]MDD4737482.1 type I DNA topoisomerase [Kiritimatiellia bacterium]
MGKKLVIVESPSKAKTINKMLGPDYIVTASMGHIRDLPQKKLGVDIEHGFKPQYGVMDGKQKVVQELLKAAEKVDGVYLAPDPDREGEAIAWHLKNLLQDKVPADCFYRVTYNEITASAIREAFEHPGEIDMRRVDSQQARRVLDRIVGYKVSPLLWRRVPGGSSAGRVQSVALRLVCEREKEISSFVKETYWVMGVNLRKLIDPRDAFEARLLKIDDAKAEIKAADLAERILSDLQHSDYSVSDVKIREIVKKPRPPYITSSLQQAASGVLGYSPSRTMSIAQRLYEGGDFGVGLITYMRTDSFNVSKEALENCRALIQQAYGADFVPEKPNYYKSRKSAQEAHEAIRPTDVTLLPDDARLAGLKPEELKLYRLIWQRFVSSQMKPARIRQRSVDVTAAAQENAAAESHTYIFRATASDVQFPGYMAVSGMEKNKNSEAGEGEDGNEVDTLPPLEAGEKLECLDQVKTEKETQPPPRYSEASLVRALEENGVGRPSTYHSILSTIQQRKYILKEKRSLRPTDSGMKVNDFLVEHLPDLFDVGFTAEMEDSLDRIEEGSVEWTAMLGEFYGHFETWLEKARGPKANPKNIEALLVLLQKVQTWGPETKRGKKTYSDKKFVESVKKQFEDGKRAVSARQRDSLLGVVKKYADQLPDWEAVLEKLELKTRFDELNQAVQPPRESTVEKLRRLEPVKFVEPRTVGKRVFDDSVFVQSLREQVEGEKRLSDRQLQYLDRLVLKYADQLGGREALVEQYGYAQDDAENQPDTESGPLLEMLQQVTTWNEPVKRGNRLWDDKNFYESLSQQFEGKKMLSVRQRASMKKMVQRYAEQISEYDAHAEELGLKKLSELKAPKKKKTKAEKEA